MSVRQSLLAILDQQACYGYQLRQEFERRTGATWPLNVGQIYNTLDRLERDGLVAKAATDSEGHVYYAITAAGRTEVGSWLGTPVQRGTGTRDELAIKLTLASTLPGVDIADVIQVQRHATLATLQELSRTEQGTTESTSPEDLARLLVVDAMIFQAEADVRWLDHIEARLGRLRAQGRSVTIPMDDTPVRRGRPPAS